MKSLRTLAFVIVLLALLIPAALPAFAARTITITEDQINNSFRVNNPVGRRISNVHVDLQPNQAVITASWTNRNTTYAIAATYVPRVSSGRVYWTVTSMTANGQPASADLITQVNNSISASWYNFVRQQAGAGRFTAITISDTAITLTTQ